MSFVFLAVEFEDETALANDLVRLCNINADDVLIINGAKKHKMFKYFKMVADLYIWTRKYHYGTPEPRLFYIRLKNHKSLPTLFALKYGEKLRLAIECRFADIVDKENLSPLQDLWLKSLGYFHQERIEVIRPEMQRLELLWVTLVSNGNPYP